MFICLATWPLESEKTAGRGTVGVKYSDPYDFPLREVKQSRLKIKAFLYGKQKTSDSGVGEKNDAQICADQATYGNSRALDFNVD